MYDVTAAIFKKTTPEYTGQFIDPQAGFIPSARFRVRGRAARVVDFFINRPILNIMTTIKKRQKILDFLNEDDPVKVHELSMLLNTSKKTIRSKQHNSEESGLMAHLDDGTAQSGGYKTEKNLWKKLQEQQEEKNAICRAAFQFIHPGMRIILDSGSTLVHLAKMVSHMNISVVTNSVLVINELMHSTVVKMFVIGGKFLRPDMALIDPQASSMFGNVTADFLFIGTTGFSIGQGISSSDPMDAEIKRQMINHSTNVCLLADSSKLEKKFEAPICGWDSIHYLITDRLSKENERKLSKQGVQVVITN